MAEKTESFENMTAEEILAEKEKTKKSLLRNIARQREIKAKLEKLNLIGEQMAIVEEPTSVIQEEEIESVQNKLKFNFDKFRDVAAQFIVKLSPHFFFEENKDKKYYNLGYQTAIWIKENPVKLFNNTVKYITEARSEEVQIQKVSFTNFSAWFKKSIGKALNALHEHTSGDYVLIKGQKGAVEKVKQEFNESLNLLGFHFENLRFDRMETFGKEFDFEKSLKNLQSDLSNIGFILQKQEGDNLTNFNLSLEKIISNDFDQDTIDEVLTKFTLPKLLNRVETISNTTQKINSMLENDKYMKQLKNISQKYKFKHENALLAILDKNPSLLNDLNKDDKELQEFLQNRKQILDSHIKYTIAFENTNFLLKNYVVALKTSIESLSEEQQKVIKESKIKLLDGSEWVVDNVISMPVESMSNESFQKSINVRANLLRH